MATIPPREPPVLQGSRLRLRAITPADKPARLAYGRDAEFHRLVGGEPARALLPFTDADAERWYSQAASDPLHWVIDLDGRMIGTARLHMLDTHNRRARYAVGIFSPEHRGKGYGQETTNLILRFAFGALQLHRVELRVLEINLRAIDTYERCGFVREGIEREGVFLGGAWHSEVLMSILDREHGTLHPA